MGLSLSDAMQWWDEWKLRVLVLCNLSVQLLLYFSTWVRVYRLSYAGGGWWCGWRT